MVSSSAYSLPPFFLLSHCTNVLVSLLVSAWLSFKSISGKECRQRESVQRLGTPQKLELIHSSV